MTEALHPGSTPRLTSVEAKTTTLSARATRLPALDFTKGTLVMIMVLYHWLNYFVGFDWPYYRYLRFLTPSFIFVTGFLISIVYLSGRGEGSGMSRRLFVRGAKLLILFVALNAMRAFVLAVLSNATAVTSQLTLKNLAAVFVIGDIFSSATGKAAAFYILVPISYLLMLSAALVPLHHAFRYTFHTVCALSFAGVLILYLIGHNSPNLEYVAIGLVGLLIGFTPIERINEVASHPIVLGIAYVGYLATITVWNVPFPILIAGVCLSLCGIYRVGLLRVQAGVARRHIMLLGKYSLFGYVSQIAILQGLSAASRHIEFGRPVQVVSFVMCFALTMTAVEAIDRMRAKSAKMDGAYRAIFA